MRNNELAWMVGGPQGSGVDTSASVFAKAAARGGLSVLGSREYYSNIMGEHSYFTVRVSEKPIRSQRREVDLLVTFEAETPIRHAHEVSPGGAILYDPSLEDKTFDDCPTLERTVRKYLKEWADAGGVDTSVKGMLTLAKRRGVQLYPVKMHDILLEIRDEYKVENFSKIQRMVNLIAVGASMGLLEYDDEPMKDVIESLFAGKPEIADMNVTGARKAYRLCKERFGKDYPFRLKAIRAKEERIFLGGNQVTALGKLLGGLRFQTYYPINPASDESVFIESNQNLATKKGVRGASAHGGSMRFASNGDSFETGEAHFLRDVGSSAVVVQTEDEIAALTMATGAALTGVRAATATSGPGFCLMVESLGWAGINEVPVVVTIYQRAGPSTGMPTRQEQGDLRFVLHAGHGYYPKITLCSGDFEEAFADAVHTLNWAERYQLPVVHLLDKQLANTTGTVAPFSEKGLTIDRGKLMLTGKPKSGPRGYERFALTPDGLSPRVPIGYPGAVFWNTGDEHDEMGHITEEPTMRLAMMEKRQRKIELAAKEIPDSLKFHLYGPADAPHTVVSWGSNKGAILDAVDRLNAEGKKVSFLQLRMMEPFPAEAVGRLLAGKRTVTDVEHNWTGELAGIIREQTGVSCTHKVLKINGRPINQDELTEALRDVVDGKAPARRMLHDGT